MNKILLAIFLIVLTTACKSQSNPKVWTKQYEQGFYNYLDSMSRKSTPQKIKREEYVNFLIKRLKQEIPNGLNSVSKDSLKSLNIRLGREYALMLNQRGERAEMVALYEPWTPLVEKTFRDNFKAVFSERYPKTTDKFCDCVIKSLKKIYPDSILLPVPQHMMSKTAAECKLLL